MAHQSSLAEVRSAAGTEFAERDTFSVVTPTGDGRRPESEFPESQPKDYFVTRDGLTFAGSHVLADMWGAHHLNDQNVIEAALRAAIDACGATLLHIHLHRFSDDGGISGVAVLAESHISVHTWPERGFAAFDIFMCGSCDPEKAVPVLKRYFSPEQISIGHHRRGVVG